MPGKKHYRFRLLLLLFACALSFSLFLSGCRPKAPVIADQEAKKIPVSVVKATKGTLEKSIPLGGLLIPQDEVYLAAKNPLLKTIQVPVKVGDEISAGTAVVLFDSREVDIQLNQARLNHERNTELHAAGAVSQAQLEQSQIALDNLLLQQEAMVLKSPISGTVSSVSAVEGQLAGSAPLVSVVNLERLKLKVQVNEVHIGRLALGAEMPVYITAVSQEPFTGTITNIAPQVDPGTKAYPVTLEIDNSENLIKGGMYGEVQLAIERREDVLLIPQYALLDQGEKKVVYVVENGQAVMKEVQPGLAVDDRLEILSGLTEGEEVINEGQYGVKDGTLVEVVARGEIR